MTPMDEHERAEQFSDDELAFLRHVRFGELPAQIGSDRRRPA